MTTEINDYWIAEQGKIIIIKASEDTIEEYIANNCSDCEYGGFKEFVDLRNDYCDDCEGPCKSEETEECDECGIELPIGCGNNPSDESIFNGCCDVCRKKEEEDKFECEWCKRLVDETEYLPSKDDDPSILGNDYCLDCYKKVENFKYVEDIPDEEKDESDKTHNCAKCSVEYVRNLMDDSRFSVLCVSCREGEEKRPLRFQGQTCWDCYSDTDNPNWEETAQCVECELNDENETIKWCDEEQKWIEVFVGAK